MTHAYIIFWDEDEKPIRITDQEYMGIMKVWGKVEHLIIKGEIIHKKAIKRIKSPQPPEPLSLPEPEPKPVSKETKNKVDEQVKAIIKKYSINS